jgi:predicted dehydrogenase
MLRIAIVGCGKIADGHVSQARATGRATVVAACDNEPLMVEQLCVRHAVPGQYTDLATMIEAERPEVLHVATPPGSHLAIARIALQAGCHVFMEKPFALDGAQTESILALARENNRHVGVNYLYNFESPPLALRRWLAEGRLGDIVHVETSYGYNLAGDYGMAVLSDPSHWVHGLPGKLFHNVLDHVLAKLSLFFTGDAEVTAHAFRRREASGNALLDALDDELLVVLREAGRTATARISAHGRPVSHAMRVVGTQDTVEIDYLNRTFVRAARWDQPSALGRLFPAWLQARRFRAEAWRNIREFRRYEYHYFQGMRTLLGEFYDAIEGKGPEPITPSQIRDVGRLMDKIVMAARGGKEPA